MSTPNDDDDVDTVTPMATIHVENKPEQDKSITLNLPLNQTGEDAEEGGIGLQFIEYCSHCLQYSIIYRLQAYTVLHVSYISVIICCLFSTHSSKAWRGTLGSIWIKSHSSKGQFCLTQYYGERKVSLHVNVVKLHYLSIAFNPSDNHPSSLCLLYTK